MSGGWFLCGRLRNADGEIGRALGFPDSEDGLPSSLVDTTIENTKKIQSAPDMKHIPSMLLDAQKGLPIEVEVIVGEVVRMARERGVSVPVRFFSLCSSKRLGVLVD